MAVPQPPGVPDPCNPAVWRWRTAAIFAAFAATLVFTTEQLARGFFTVPGGSAQGAARRASRWSVKQRKRRRVRVVDVIQRRDTGRAQLVLGLRRPRDVEHSVLFTDFC